MTLTPSKYEVQLVYECPSCSIEHYATVDETRFPGGVLCYCGKKIKFKAIYGTKITLKTKEWEKKENVKKEVDNRLLEDIISALCNTGYKKSEAKKKAMEAINIYDNVEDCINYCFK
tara:strand:- start:306 stop:656 length:351 start_codon:yes stop_codon:yes gene_type:complete